MLKMNFNFELIILDLKKMNNISKLMAVFELY